MTAPVTEKQIDALKAAAHDQDALLLLALSDAASAFAEFAVVSRTRDEALGLLENWRGVFERHTLERRKRR